LTGLGWLLTQGSAEAVGWRYNHALAARGMAVMLVLHIVSVSLHCWTSSGSSETVNNNNDVGGTHRWRFFRCGGFDQVAIETGEDLRHLAALDPKLWTALSCPTSGLEFDARTLALLDTDGDGQIRVPEILEAVAGLPDGQGSAGAVRGRRAAARGHR
jgi:hypothetical protein